MRRRNAVLVAAGMLAAALGLSLLVPDEQLLQSPYVTRIAVGDRVELRSFAVNVTDVRLAERVQSDDWIGTTDGIWLAIDLEFERTIRYGGIKGALRIDDVRFATSRRPDLLGSAGASSAPGLPVSTTMLFELPLTALQRPGSADAVLRLGTDEDAFLDDVAELHIDLTGIEPVASLSFLEPGRVAS